jgi:peptidoglycan hydrolase-like protein with peptidoglycan-binding domain
VSASRPRGVALAGIGLVLVAVVVIAVSNPFAGSGKPGGAADNATPTSLATVTRQAISSQTQVGATLGYAGGSSIRIPSGSAPSAVQQAQQAVGTAEGMLRTAKAALSADGATLANLQATVSAAREKESVDCAGDNAAEGAPGGSSPSVCASDVATLASDGQGSSGAAMKLGSDRAAVSSAQAALTNAEAGASAARSSAADYGQGSTFTMLPAVGRVIVRGQILFALSGQPTVLLYGSVLPSRAYRAGMSPSSDVAALNANLDALGYGSGFSGKTFSSATEAAVKAFQSARGMPATGELALGSVVFERGPIRVTSVTPEVGANVTPGPVLGITSTVPQVSIALSAAQQSSVKVGDPVSVTLPNSQTTSGVVSSVGTVAKAPASKGGEGGGGGGGGEEGGATIEVNVRLEDPTATGHLDEAPVTVSITTASAENALVVPIDALLALAGGGYALEVSEGGAHHLEAVRLGLFDDAEGLVQVGGAGVSAGQRVVVPAT